MNVPVFALVWFAFRDLQALPAHPTEPQVSAGSTDHSLRDTLKSKTVWILAIFLMLYVGYDYLQRFPLVENEVLTDLYFRWNTQEPKKRCK